MGDFYQVTLMKLNVACTLVYMSRVHEIAVNLSGLLSTGVNWIGTPLVVI